MQEATYLLLGDGIVVHVLPGGGWNEGVYIKGEYRDHGGCEKSPLKVKRTLSGMKPGGVLFFVVKLSYYE